LQLFFHDRAEKLPQRPQPDDHEPDVGAEVLPIRKLGDDAAEEAHRERRENEVRPLPRVRVPNIFLLRRGVASFLNIQFPLRRAIRQKHLAGRLPAPHRDDDEREAEAAGPRRAQLRFVDDGVLPLYRL